MFFSYKECIKEINNTQTDNGKYLYVVLYLQNLLEKVMILQKGQVVYNNKQPNTDTNNLGLFKLQRTFYSFVLDYIVS